MFVNKDKALSVAGYHLIDLNLKGFADNDMQRSVAYLFPVQ
jgi:hypothetical protein